MERGQWNRRLLAIGGAFFCSAPTLLQDRDKPTPRNRCSYEIGMSIFALPSLQKEHRRIMRYQMAILPVTKFLFHSTPHKYTIGLDITRLGILAAGKHQSPDRNR